MLAFRAMRGVSDEGRRAEHEEVMVAPWQMAPVQSGRWIETSLPQLLAQKRLQSHDPLLPAAATKSSSWPGGQVIGVGVGAAQVRVLQ